MLFFNRKLLATAVLIGSVTLLAGCQEKLEAPSMAVLHASVQKVSKDMDPVEKVKFQEAFQTGLNYVYAKNHNGRTPEENIGNIFGQMINGIQGKNADTAADDATEKEILKLMDGKTASDVIDEKGDWDQELVKLKAQWQKAQEEQAAARQKQIQENARTQQLEFARQRKTQITQNIAMLQSNIPKIQAQISDAETAKKPYSDAVADYSKVEIKNIVLRADGPRKRFVEYDIVNGSSLTFNQIIYQTQVTAGSASVYGPRQDNERVDGTGVAPGATYHISDNISASGAYRYDPSDLKVSVSVVTATNIGKKISVAETLNDAGWKRWSENDLVAYKNQLEQTNQQISQLQSQLADLDKANATTQQ